MEDKTKTIAVIAWGAMADVLYATPIVRKIRESHPKDHIVWIVRDKFAEVVETNPHITSLIKWKLPEGFNSRQEAEYEMDRQILKYAQDNYDKVYDLQYWPRYANFFENPSEDFISLRARNAGIDPASIKNRSITILPKDSDIIEADRFMVVNNLKGYVFITVNHISYAASPVCNFEFYEKLVEIMNEAGISVVFTGATNEPIPKNGIDARGLPYRVWQVLIAKSDFYLGLDSGAKTLACSTNTPMIILHSKDFSLKKTGCVSMGIRTSNILELTTIPTVTSLSDTIISHISNGTNR